MSVLEAIGRGAEKPSEIAARLETAQTNLSRLLQQLLDASVLTREIPFGESLRTTKKSLYRIQDPALRFWFKVYSPHRTRWREYPPAEKIKLLRDHAATVFEDFCRMQRTGAARYWEPGLEFDLVRVERHARAGERAVVSEVKLRQLSTSARTLIKENLAAAWQRCALRRRFPRVIFEVLDAGILKHVR